MPLALKIIRSFEKFWGSYEKYQTSLGPVLSYKETGEQHFAAENGLITVREFDSYIASLDIKGLISYRFTYKTISPTTIVHKPKGRAEIVVGLPLQYRKRSMAGLLHHEIGTHFLRKFNDRRQIWFEKRKKYKLKKYITTEEGLATIHMLYEQALLTPRKPFLFQAALNYVSSFWASEMGFAELFKTLQKYIRDESKVWRQCMRVKRSKGKVTAGLKDTSQSGGMFKDQVYLRGAHDLLSKRKKIDFRLLYCGKLSLKDFKKMKKKKMIIKGESKKRSSSCLFFFRTIASTCPFSMPYLKLILSNFLTFINLLI